MKMKLLIALIEKQLRIRLGKGEENEKSSERRVLFIWRGRNILLSHMDLSYASFLIQVVINVNTICNCTLAKVVLIWIVYCLCSSNLSRKWHFNK